MIPSVYVLGAGFWTPGFADWSSFVAGVPNAALVEPATAGIPVRILRGTSLATRMALDVAMQAIAEGGADATTIPAVFGSYLGEIQTALAMLDTIHAEGVPSPLRFTNSVHNAAAGSFSIAFGNRAASTSVCAGDDLVAIALLEAFSWLAMHPGPMLVALSEETVPAPLPGAGETVALGVGLLLSTDNPGGDAPSLAALERGACRPMNRDRAFGRNPVAPGVALLRALRDGFEGTVALSSDDDPPWTVCVAPGGRA